MSKEQLSPLEAFNKVKEVSWTDDWDNLYFLKKLYKEELDIIEATLKDYERKLALAKEYEDVNNVGKRLKAFEIIKEKMIDVNIIIECNDYQDYLHSPAPKNIVDEKGNYHEEQVLTQEEYDLLKEVLL